jgi:hypothetical protein
MSVIELLSVKELKDFDEIDLENDCRNLEKENNTISISEKCVEKLETKSLPERIPAFGLLMAFIAVFFFSIQSVIVKVLNDLHAIQILVIRFVNQQNL